MITNSYVTSNVRVEQCAAVVWMLRKNTAAARHSVWSAAVAAQLLIPFLVSVLPTWRVPVLDEPTWIAPASS